MNNLHRELAPISEAAWADMEEEARRTFASYVAGRRVADVAGPDGPELSAVGLGRLTDVDSPGEGVRARLRRAQPLVELRVPFTVSRQEIDDVERGAQDADWQPVKDAARQIAFAEDRAIFEGYEAAGITGIQAAAANAAVELPADAHAYPNAVTQALTALRLAGVGGPYSLVLSNDAYTAVSRSSDYGYPIRDQLAKLVDDIAWAPAIGGAFLVSTRGGDFELHFGQDLSIGYLSHDATGVELYFQESLTFLVHTDEAAVALRPAS